jgi:hypothetical protein
MLNPSELSMLADLPLKPDTEPHKRPNDRLIAILFGSIGPTRMRPDHVKAAAKREF